MQHYQKKMEPSSEESDYERVMKIVVYFSWELWVMTCHNSGSCQTNCYYCNQLLLLLLPKAKLYTLTFSKTAFSLRNLQGIWHYLTGDILSIYLTFFREDWTSFNLEMLLWTFVSILKFVCHIRYLGFTSLQARSNTQRQSICTV